MAGDEKKQTVSSLLTYFTHHCSIAWGAMGALGQNNETSPRQPTQSKPLRSRCGIAVWLATGLGVGRLPLMPGTYGSALGVGLYLGLAALANRTAYPKLGLCAAAVALAGISLFLISAALRSFREEDPPVIVLDEVAGQVLTLLPLPLPAPGTNSYWEAVAAGFLLFRCLDSIKPYPISKLERLAGAWGILADDVGAGLVAAALLSVLLRGGLLRGGLLQLWSPF